MAREIFFIYDCNIGFLAKAFNRKNSNYDGEPGDYGGDGASNRETTGRKNSPEERRDECGTAGGAAGTQSYESGDDASFFDIGGVGGCCCLFLLPEEGNQAD